MTETIKSQAFIVKNGKVLSLSGEWWTPEQLLLKVKERIIAEPDNYDQFVWACNTPRCIGGWCDTLTIGHFGNASEDERLCTFLHGVRKWPWLFGCNFDGHSPIAGYYHVTAEEGAAAIDVFIAEMRPYWSEHGKA